MKFGNRFKKFIAKIMCANFFSNSFKFGIFIVQCLRVYILQSVN